MCEQLVAFLIGYFMSSFAVMIKIYAGACIAAMVVRKTRIIAMKAYVCARCTAVAAVATCNGTVLARTSAG